MNESYKNWTVEVDVRGVCSATLDVPGRPMNVLDQDVMTELEQIVSMLENRQDIRLVVFSSSKESGFLAGADVNVIANIESQEAAARLIEDGQLLFRRIEWLPMKTIAVIHGPCLGGGLELSLACDYRIARDNSSTKIGLPEIKLGLIPGWGGTQRLPKLVGLMNSLPLILQGKFLDARQALRIGLIDQAVSPEKWSDAVERFVTERLNDKYILLPKSRRKFTNRLMEKTGLGRAMILRAAKKKIRSKTEQFPALTAAIKAISANYKSSENGFAVEREEFSKLLATPTCRSLLQLFFAREKARNLNTWTSCDRHSVLGAPIQRVAVIGAGAMGAGIGQLAAIRGFDVVLKEIDEDAAKAGRKRIAALVNSFADRKRWSDEKRKEMLERIVVTCDDAPLKSADLIVEAIVERMDVKQSVFKALDAMVDSDTILATNTSSLSVDEMATAVTRPSKLGGLHFFNPVHRMELVEVVRGAETDEQTVARLVAFVKALGKTPVVTSDSPGFLVNRVLFPYLGEAILMVREGFDVRKVDKDLRRFGMPMGPLELLDQVGLDVALHVAKSLSSVLVGVEPVVETLQAMVDNGHLGKKANAGFYRYVKGRRGEAASMESLPKSQPAAKSVDEFSDDGLTEIQRRLVYPMLAEAIRCYEEQVVSEPWACDLAMVLGTGFAPHLGGPLRVVDTMGAHRVLSNMRRLKATCGPRFEPPQGLTTMVDSGSKFYEQDDSPEQSHVQS